MHNKGNNFMNIIKRLFSLALLFACCANIFVMGMDNNNNNNNADLYSSDEENNELTGNNHIIIPAGDIPEEDRRIFDNDGDDIEINPILLQSNENSDEENNSNLLLEAALNNGNVKLVEDLIDVDADITKTETDEKLKVLRYGTLDTLTDEDLKILLEMGFSLDELEKNKELRENVLESLAWKKYQDKAIESMHNKELHWQEVKRQEVKKKKSQRVLNEELEQACYEGNLEKIQECIENGADVEYKVEDESSEAQFDRPLAVAIKSQNLAMVKILVAAGAKILAPYLASGLNNIPLLRALLSSNNLSDWAQDRLSVILKDMLTDIDDKISDVSSRDEIIRLLLAKGAKISANHLTRAIQDNDVTKIRLLQKYKAPLDSTGLAALYKASPEIQELVLTQNSPLSLQAFNDFIEQHKKQECIDNKRNFYIEKYNNFDSDIKFLKEVNIKFDEKVFKKSLMKKLLTIGFKFEKFVYKVACAYGIIPANKICEGKTIDELYPLLKHELTKSFYDKMQVYIDDNMQPGELGKIVAAACGHTYFLTQYALNIIPFSRKYSITKNEKILLRGLFGGKKYNVLDEKEEPLWNRLLQAAVVNHQVDTAKTLISLCNVADDTTFEIIKNNLDALSDVKKSLVLYHESEIKREHEAYDKQNEYAHAPEQDIYFFQAIFGDENQKKLKLRHDIEQYVFEKMQTELKLYLCKFRSFVKALQSRGIAPELAMQIVAYAPYDVQRLPLKRKKEAQQKLITDYFKKKPKN